MPDGGTPIPPPVRLKPGSQNARIVAALASSGGWMSTAEIHRAAGFSRLNSRIAELREYGYVVPSRHVEGKVGPHGTEYMLVSTPGGTVPQGTAGALDTVDVGPHPGAPPVGPVLTVPPGTETNAALDEPTSEPVPGQLSLEVAA